jgi:hypothetical protein
MRATSRCTSSSKRTVESDSSQFMAIRLRIAVNPECISAQIDLACARAARSSGHSFFSQNFSATYSAIERLSHTTMSSSIKTGTWPTGE